MQNLPFLLRWYYSPYDATAHCALATERWLGLGSVVAGYSQAVYGHEDGYVHR